MRRIVSIILSVIVAASAGVIFAQETSKPTELSIVLLSKPCRLLDTRISGTPMADGEVRWVQVRDGIAGSICSIPEEARGIMVNLVAVDPEAKGNLLFWAGFTTPPTASSINFTPGENVANEITVKLNIFPGEHDAAIKARVDGVGKRVHVVADIVGYLVHSH